MARVAVTGAAGQIGYAILFRIASGQMLGPDETIDLRLVENRAVAMLANKLGAGVEQVQDLVVWGNHSPTMFPDLFNAKVRGERAVDAVDDMAWYENEYMPRVGKRGAEVIEARGASSAASAANAAIDHVQDWWQGADGLRSMGTPSRGWYGIEEGLVCSVPCRCSGGSVHAACETTLFPRARIIGVEADAAKVAELVDAVVLGRERVLTLTVRCEGERGLDGEFAAVPVRVGAGGVKEILEQD